MENNMQVDCYKALLNLILNTRHLKELDDIEEDKLLEVVEVLNQNGINDFSECVKIGSGTYSTVYKLGNKVVKIGLAKLNTEILEDSRIVKIYYKNNIAITKNGFKMVLGIEIQDFVEVIEKVEERDLYKVYKDLRDNNFVWTDVKSSNVGISDGKFVVVDVDSIYREDNPKIEWFTVLAQNFEKTYKEDMNCK